MATLLLSNKTTGLNSHLRSYKDGSSMFCNDILSSDIIVNSKDWFQYLKTTCKEAPSLLPETQRKALETVLREEEIMVENLPAFLLLSKEEYQTNLHRYMKELISFFALNPATYFFDFFKKEVDLLEKMQGAYISEDLYHKYRIQDTQGLVSTFSPNRDGFAKPVKYDSFKSPTGRLVVTEGPHILTINKTYRNMVQTSFEKGAIVSIDYVALEPSVLLGRTSGALSNWLSSTQGSTNSKPHDIYQQVADILFQRNLLRTPIDRSEAKSITLRTLYGAQEDLIGQILQGKSSVPLHDFLFELRELFGINQLMNQLQSERRMRNNGGKYITNHFERRIPTEGVEDYKLVNYWTQSTAVDVALLGFASLIEDLNPEEVRPLFVLHDAIFLDVSLSAVSKLKSAINKAKTVPLFPNSHFHLKLSVESQSQ